MKRQDKLTSLLRFLVRSSHNVHNPIRSHDFDERLRELGVDPSLTDFALTRGYLMLEPSQTNILLNGPHFHWIWVTAKGADYVTAEASHSTVKDRLFLDELDSFARVRQVQPALVTLYLRDGYLDITEDRVQAALEAILDVPFHKNDWGGEGNDLYTANVIADGERRPTAFLLKGNGLKRSRMEIRHCGRNGDQIVRLFQSPADLFVIQFVGNIAEAVIHHAQSELARVRMRCPQAQFLIVDGQDTARLLHAYGKLPAYARIRRKRRNASTGAC
jgi:hypothetical protein